MKAYIDTPDFKIVVHLLSVATPSSAGRSFPRQSRKYHAGFNYFHEVVIIYNLRAYARDSADGPKSSAGRLYLQHTCWGLEPGKCRPSPSYVKVEQDCHFRLLAETQAPQCLKNDSLFLDHNFRVWGVGAAFTQTLSKIRNKGKFVRLIYDPSIRWK